ncbi:predicted protein [Naegleria gruberi]|uniref:Predicted protein n=1 Tax=Naegleria gruberi TaxID=5762 RepID=D2VWQ8_NAEGR|nr:uncharacterized protein NAEGRDRAFT_52864 [Naegleria gruberi]EFC38741.1 predicted protein [Naegleria gruberi]|eukprot:XP_002671485.1 predicted protein [Naegleria gruberi strain NEG-M]
MMCILLLIGFGSANGEIGSSSNSNNLLSDINPKYKIKITENINVLSDVENMDIVYMNFEKELHRCHIPVKKNNSQSEETVKKETLEEKTERIKKEIVENIFPKFISNCYFRIAGWWLYEFCFNKFVRQFHQEQHTVTNEYFLGYSKEQSPTNKNVKYFDINFNEQTPEESYISIPFEKGTPCDLTKQPRTLELRMYCATDLKRRQLTNPNAHGEASAHFVGDIEEPSTCSYSLKFYSNHLCKLEGFAPKKEYESNTIYCIPETVFSNEEKDVDLMKAITEESEKILMSDDLDSDVVTSTEIIGGEETKTENQQSENNDENSKTETTSTPPIDATTSSTTTQDSTTPPETIAEKQEEK